MSEPSVLQEADFDLNVKKYWIWQPVFVISLFIVTIPIAIIYALIASFFIDRYLASLSCTLTERTLDIKKGIFNKTESTIPLEKITDLQLFQGPIMRYFGLHGFKVETAGQSSGPGGSLVNIIGIVETKDFRKAVLAQRDRLHDREGSLQSSRTSPSEHAVSGSEQAEVLADIRDILKRVEDRLKRTSDG